MKKILFLSFVTLMISCKKNNTSVSVKDTLIKHTWKSTVLTSNGVTQTKWCWLSSLYNFTSDNKLFYTQGDDLGACSGDPIGTITQLGYSISADEKWLITHYGSSTPSAADSFQIISINDATLKTERIVNKNSPSQFVWDDTFTAVP